MANDDSGAWDDINEAKDNLNELINEWTSPDVSELIEGEINFGDWQGMVDDYLSDAPDTILHDFDIGFGPGMADAGYEEMMSAREEFLDWMIDNGYDLADFWEDWRENYETV